MLQWVLDLPSRKRRLGLRNGRGLRSFRISPRFGVMGGPVCPMPSNLDSVAEY